MKKKLLLLIPLASLLTGCFLVPENYETEKHQTNAYNLSAVTGETQNYSEILSNTVEYRTIKDEPLVPYLTLVDYAKLFTPFFTENTSLVATTTSLEVYLNKEPVFVAMVQFSSKRILMAGSLSETLKSNQELPPSLDFRMKYDAKLRKLYGNYSIFSYKGFDFKTFGKYLPLSVWDNVFNRELDVYTYFNYQNFYLFEDVSLLQTTSLKGDGEEKYSPFDEAHTVIDTYDAEYNFFPDKYIRTVVIPGAAWHFYVMDEEGLQTAPQYMADYENGKFIMQRDMLYKIPEEYQDDDNQGFIVGDPESDIFGDRGLVVDIDV